MEHALMALIDMYERVTGGTVTLSPVITIHDYYETLQYNTIDDLIESMKVVLCDNLGIEYFPEDEIDCEVYEDENSN